MKKYIVTEQDIETLSQLFPDLGEGLTVSRIVEGWVETLNYLDTDKAYTIIAPLISPKKIKKQNDKI